MTDRQQTTLSAGISRDTLAALRRFFAEPFSRRPQILSDLGVHRGIDGTEFERDRKALLDLKAAGRLEEIKRHV